MLKENVLIKIPNSNHDNNIKKKKYRPHPLDQGHFFQSLFDNHLKSQQ